VGGVETTELVVAEEENAKADTKSGAAKHEERQGEAGHLSGEPGALDGGAVETEVGKEALGSAHDGKPSGVGFAVGETLLTVSDGSDRHFC